jgi:hypothetical protein
MCSVAASAQVNQDGGPETLSRNPGRVQQLGDERTTIRPYFSLSGFYDTAMIGSWVVQPGDDSVPTGYGSTIEFGLIGGKRWRRTTMSLDYRGNYRRYSRRTLYEGTDQSFSLNLRHLLSARTSLILHESLASYARGYGVANDYSPFDPALASVPVDEIVNSRVSYFSSGADLVFQKTARLSLSGGAGGTLVRRQSSALVGSMSASARGNASYRTSRNTTVGVSYSYVHTEFTRAYGSSDNHSAAGEFTYRFSGRWDLGLRGGVSRVTLKGLQRLDLDPVLAALFGVPYFVVAYDRAYLIPSVGGRLSWAGKRSSFSLSYSHDPGYGNGIYTTTRSHRAGIGYGFTGTRKLHIGLSADYSYNRSLSHDLGAYTYANGGCGATYRLKEWLHFTSGYNARLYDLGLVRRLDHQVSVGMAFSPGERPLPLF